jgi:hypothetical protein
MDKEHWDLVLLDFLGFWGLLWLVGGARKENNTVEGLCNCEGFILFLLRI